MRRPRMSTGSDGAAPQRSEPETKRPMAVTKTRRAPKRSATQPEAGMKTAMATR